MNPLVKYLAAIIVFLSAVIGAYFYGVRASDNAWHARQAQDAVKAQAAVDKVTAENASIIKDKAASDARIQDLQQQIANQKPQEKIVYVKVNSNPMPVAVVGPVYVTRGAVELFDAAFNVPDLSGAASGDNGAPDAISGVTISDYIDTTERNATACYQNQVQVTLLQRYILSLNLKPAA